MQLHFAYTFPAPVDKVFAVLTSAELYAHLDDEAMVEIKQHDHIRTVRIERAFPTDDIPSSARSLVGDSIEIVEETRWEATGKGFSAEFDVRTPGKPLTFIGTAELTSKKSTTEFELSGTVKVNVPLVGAGLEKQVAALLQQQLEATVEQAQELLD